MSAILALRMHHGRVHGTIKLPSETGRVKPKPTKATVGAGHTESQVRKLEYQRRWRMMQRKRKLVGNGAMAMHFCPRCGMNLEVLGTALQVASKVQI